MFLESKFELRNSHGTLGAYCLDIASGPSNYNIAVPCSANSIQLFETTNLSKVSVLDASFCSNATQFKSDIPGNLTACEFLDNNTIIASRNSLDGPIILFDIRSPNAFANAVIYVKSPVTSIAVNNSASIISAGCELIKSKSEHSFDEYAAKICLYDPRNPGQPITEFVESHSDDITQVKFSPTTPNLLLTGSTDGTLCTFDINLTEEDDALQQTIRDNSIQKLGFLGPYDDYIFSLTHIETLSIFRTCDGEEVASFGDIRKNQCDRDYFVGEYTINCQYIPTLQRLFLYAGNRGGTIGIYNVDINTLDLVHVLEGGHRDIVRGLLWEDNSGALLSCGEDGIVSLWKNS